MSHKPLTPGSYVEHAVYAQECDEVREALKGLFEECAKAGKTHIGVSDIRQIAVSVNSIYRLERLLGKKHSALGLEGKPHGLDDDEIDLMDAEDVERELRRLRQPVRRGTSANRTRLRLARVGL